MELAIILTFVIGYFAITLKHSIKINKAATALVTGVLCWTIYIWFQPDKHPVSEQLMQHLGDVSGRWKTIHAFRCLLITGIGNNNHSSRIDNEISIHQFRITLPIESNELFMS